MKHFHLKIRGDHHCWLLKKPQFSPRCWQNFFFNILATSRNRRNTVGVSREPPENTRNIQSENTLDPEMSQKYISKGSEEIEGWVTEKFSKEIRRTESRILGGLSKPDEFLLNPQLRTHSGTVPGAFRNTHVENQGTNEKNSLSGPHPETSIFRSQTAQNSSPEVGHDMVTRFTDEVPIRHELVTGVLEESRNGHYMVTRVQEEISYRPHMATGIQEDIPYYSTGNLPGRQKKQALQVSHNFAVKTPLRHLKQTRYWQPFIDWPRTVI